MVLTLPRRLGVETLDHLAEDDPRAIRSRGDLRRINWLMGSGRIIARALLQAAPGAGPRSIIELGAGDGRLMLSVARRLAPRWPAVKLTLLDRQDVVDAPTLRAFAELGWRAEVMRCDVKEWISAAPRQRWDIAVANLFIHHFAIDEITALFHALEKNTDLFVACEPRRAYLPLAGSYLVGLMGANDVTRRDAVLSVQAGFCGQELSALWPQQNDAWRLTERPAGFFSHCLVAVRAS